MMTWLGSPTLPAHQGSAGAASARGPLLGRRLFLALAAVALVYTFLAGLRTIVDPDLGWQMATGRWIALHHHTFSTDVFSYTASGRPWIYPVGSGLLFYAIYLLGGYTLLSWVGAAACVGTVALLLRRGSAFTAAIAILAVPLIAERTTPRAEMFTVMLFAAYLSVLWQYRETGRAPLWCLPVLMIAWVNLHLGFIAGLMLIGGFIGLEFLDMVSASRRREALERLRRSVPWYAVTAAATLINPWGWGLYQAIIRQDRAMAQHSQLITEWASVRWNWSGSIPGFSQQPLQNTFTLLMLVVVIAVLAALWERQAGAAILLVGAMYESMRHIRMEALTACIVVVVAGAMLSAAVPRLSFRIADRRMRAIVALAAAVVFAALAVVRAAGYVTNRIYLASNSLSSFGTGPAWWLPQRAAEFLEREKLPANVFNSYMEGGYLIWKLGPQYRDYIDGRAIPFGGEAIEHERELLATSLDSPMWQQEADRYDIRTVIIPLEGNEIAFDQLQDLCYGSNWRPVYLDELAIILLRRKPDNEDLISRLQVTCPTVPLPATPLDHSARSFPQWVNSAYMLMVLRRNAEALTAANNGLQIFPDSARLHRVRGNILYGLYRRSEAEQEWLTALSLSPGDRAADASVWSRLAELYEQQDRTADAIHAWQETVRLTPDPTLKPRSLVKLARLYLGSGKAKAALQALDEAVRSAPPPMLEAGGGRSFSFDVAQGRAAAWRSLGDLQQATAFEEQAVQLDPDAADAWSHLAKLYQRQGRVADERRAEERASALGTTPTP
ncbi:MAG TPA: tetratricopeptide repeat protein [Candidatus Binatia bacterium]|nr:tetratricopeptide repeat protein [Candidatus Binatia bacterium]